MSVYLMCMVRVDDPETYSKYTAETPGLIAKHGGKFLVRGGPVEAIEGAPFGDRLVLLEFPTREAVDRFYRSDEYQAVAKFRWASSESRFLLAEGVDPTTAAPDAKVVRSG